MVRNPNYAQIAFDFVDAVAALQDGSSILKALKTAAGQLGFTSFIVTGLPLPNRPLEPLVLLNAWPQEWFRRYIAMDYFRRDPVSQQALVTSSPFVWREIPTAFSQAPEATQLMGEAREFGLADGFCVPIYSITGWQAGLSFASDREIDISQRERAAMHLMAITAHGRIRALHGEATPANPKLTPREREVLTWAAAGKTAWETSEILSVAEKTVRAHLESIRRKLNVVTTTQAVAMALLIGELQPY
jgi:LuxR family quorum sensing-dependent transcriptional regulator